MLRLVQLLRDVAIWHLFQDRPQGRVTGCCGFGDHLADVGIAENDTALLCDSPLDAMR
jgi:hypothetical protein